MIEELEHFLRCREHLRENIHHFKEAFIAYYGEEYREEIEEKFNSAIFLAYRNPDSTRQYLSKLSDHISKEIIDKAMENLHIQLGREDLFERYSFEFSSIQPIHKYQEFLEQFELGPEGRIEVYKEAQFKSLKHFLPELTREEYEEMVQTQTIPSKYNNVRPWLKDNLAYSIDLKNVDKIFEKRFEDIKDLLHKIDPNITQHNFGYYLDDPDIVALNQLSEEYPKMLDEYKTRMKKYEAYRLECEQQEKTKHALSEEYYLKLIDENIDLVPEEELEGLEIFRKDRSKSYKLGSYINYIFSYGLGSNHPLDAFTTESKKKLENEKEASWKKETIKKERIEFFKRNGIDLGDDYEAYVNSPEAKKVWPTEERANRFVDSRDRLRNEFNIEYYSNTPEHLSARKEIEEKGFLDKDDSWNASLYTNFGCTFVNPNVIQTKDGYKLCSIVAINCDQQSGHIDHDIIHELNHLFELNLQSVKDDEYHAICGWDPCDGRINQTAAKKLDTLKKDNSKRDYELFNEIINEVIAQEICHVYRKDHPHVFDNDQNEQIKFATSYEHSLFLVRDFFAEFKKEIIESRRNGNIEIIWNRVGKENFDELNNLFHIFFENFDGYKIYSVLQSIHNHEDNEKTRLYFDLAKRSAEILDKMKKYSMFQEEKPKRGRKKKEETATKK